MELIEQLSFEEIFSRMKEELARRDENFTALEESDPAIKILEIAAWAEMLLRQIINEAATSNLLKFARGKNLDTLAEFYGVERQEGEDDEQFRKRIKTKIVGWSTGGSKEYYRYHALSADTRVKDALVESKLPGSVRISVLSTKLSTDSEELINIVREKVNQDNIRVLTDTIEVVGCNIIEIDIHSRIIVQKQLDENRERARVRRKGRRHLLQGLVACVCCKYSYYVSTNNQENRYYRCTGTEASRCYGTKVCNSKSVKAEILEMAVWDEIKKILKDPDAIVNEYRLRMLKHENEEPNDKLEKERSRLEQGIKRLAHVYIQGYISQEEYDQEVGEMEKKLKVIVEQQEKTVNEKKIESELDFSIGGLKAFASEFESELDQANFETKLKIILYLVRGIKIDQDDVYIVFRFQEAAMEMQKKMFNIIMGSQQPAAQIQHQFGKFTHILQISCAKPLHIRKSISQTFT